MNSPSADTAGQLIVQISHDDLGPLLVDGLHLECNSLSPLADIVRAYRPGARPASPSTSEISRHPLFSSAAAILTQPDLRILHRTGGGAVDVSYVSAFGKRSENRETVVTVTPSTERSILVRLFESPDRYLVWWLDTMASRVETSTPNYMPPPIRLESLVYLLHAVDAYRRASFESMLSYTPTAEPSITTSAFAETMNASIGSRDLRWLLPSFLYLTPGLSDYSFSPGAEHLARLAEHDFLLTAKKADTEEDIFIFGEAGRTMGVEFYRTWMSAVGFESTVLVSSQERTLNRGFLAPTALANHLFLLESDGAGGCAVNHQALTLDELATKMKQILLKALSSPMADAGPSAARPVASQTASVPPAAGPGTPAQRFCGQCGSPNKIGDKFCASCGAAL
ncbi:MAG: zinc ribbon domain-containing protein [Dehalococcoidia bacterium]|nr:zinc ribbon domain-containing protein [Dehalococcoidia bacterium]